MPHRIVDPFAPVLEVRSPGTILRIDVAGRRRRRRRRGRPERPAGRRPRRRRSRPSRPPL